ncbi:hypothetical protein JCM11251_004189 [Rhodosporidiobolus azoricus]
MVGWAFALFATPLALHCLRNPSIELDVDPLYGHAEREARLNAMAVGYFAWDAFVTAKHIRTQGLGFFLHGFGCFTAFLFTLRPFLMWCGPNFLIVLGTLDHVRPLLPPLLLRLSPQLLLTDAPPPPPPPLSPPRAKSSFLNAHWLFDKLKMTGSLAQMINGLCLVTTYISARLLWGTYNSYRLWTLLLPSASDSSLKAEIARTAPLWIRVLYMALNVLMNGLNFFWFRLMLLALLKRFKPSPSSSSSTTVPTTKPVPDAVQKGRLDADGKAKGE